MDVILKALLRATVPSYTWLDPFFSSLIGLDEILLVFFQLYIFFNFLCVDCCWISFRDCGDSMIRVEWWCNFQDGSSSYTPSFLGCSVYRAPSLSVSSSKLMNQCPVALHFLSLILLYGGQQITCKSRKHTMERKSLMTG